MVKILENAQLQQETIQKFSYSKSGEVNAIQNSNTNYHNSPKTRTKRHVLVKGRDCFNCGGKRHKAPGDLCPAKGKICNHCKSTNHFSKCCLKSGKVKIVKGLNKVTVGQNDSSDHDSESDSDAACCIRKIEEGSEAFLSVKINGQEVEMLFDSGAAKSVIGESVWKKIGSPELKPTSSLLAYTGLVVETLGTTKVNVTAFNKTLRLPVTVVKNEDVPLFGMKWILAFNLPLPPGASIRKINRKRTKHNTADTQKTPTKSTLENQTIDKELSNIIQKYKEVFREGTGTIKNVKAKIHLKQNSQPKIFKPRRVPLALKSVVERELDRLVANEILETVDPTATPIEWASPIVVITKASGKVRICGDFKVTINQHIHSDYHPLPTFEDLVAKLNGGTQFSVIDLRDAYLQMEVEESSRKYLTIATHKGFYQYRRLPFGVSFAPGLFQRTMEHILADLTGVACLLDDIIVTGANKEEHLQTVEMVLKRLQSSGLRIQESKCKWLQNEVVYLGHQINKTGIKPTTEHLKAILEMPEPTCAKELRAFLGSINYYGRFIPNLQSECVQLHNLLKKNAKWKWTPTESEIVRKLKNLLTSATALAHYDPHLPLILTSDASDKGLGAVIFHRFPDKSERAIAFASRTLKKSEQSYSALDKETLGIIFALSKFRHYLLGRHFILKTDHKPLIHLLNQNSEIPKLAANRLTRWAQILASFDYEIEHQSGTCNAPADALSRLPLTDDTQSPEEADGNIFSKKIFQIRLDDLSLSKKHLKKEITKDSTLAMVVKHIRIGWPESKSLLAKEVHTYFEKRDELSLEEDVLLWNGRLVIPTTLRKSVLNVLHEGHPGITGMRSVAKLHVWWPNIDREIDSHVGACEACQENRIKEPEVPLFSWNVPAEKWSRLHIDFCGPFEGRYWMLLGDARIPYGCGIPSKISI